jgi:ABC-2 type transport system ATP-binding protein
MADRIGVIDHGRLILVERKADLMRKLGKKRLVLDLLEPLGEVPQELAGYRLSRSGDGLQLTYEYDTQAERTGITALLQDLARSNIRFKDLDTNQSSLEEIFVNLVRRAQ